MQELNASKARENLEGLAGVPVEAYSYEKGRAKGFLEAHALAERVLMKALEDIHEHSQDPFQGDKWRRYIFEVAEDALSEWRKANGD